MHPIIKRLCAMQCILICSINLAFASASNIRFDKLGIEDGLSVQVVTAIFQDSKGYLWFGTQEGLNRYDGFEFTPFLHDPNDPTSISDGWITSLSEDIYGNIWVGTTAGLNILGTSDNTFTRVNVEKSDVNGHAQGYVDRVWRDIDGDMWFSINGTLFQHNHTMDRYAKYVLTDSDNHTLTGRYYFYDTQSGIWVIAQDNRIYFKPNAETEFSSVELDLLASTQPNSKNAHQYELQKIYIDSSRRIWIATADGKLFVSDFVSSNSIDAFTQVKFHSMLPESNSTISTIYEDSSGTVWIGTDTQGLSYISQDGQTGTQTFDIAVRTSISSNDVNAILEDRSGVLWVGTFNGLNKWNTAHVRFDHINVTATKQFSLTGPNITGIDTYVDGRIFISTTEGLNLYDPTSGEVTQFLPDSTSNSILEMQVMSLAVVSATEVFLGYRSRGVSKFNPVTNQFVHYVPEPEVNGKLQSGAIPAIKKTRDGQVFLATISGGLHRYLPHNDTFEYYQHDPNNEFSLSSNDLISISEGRDGLLWLGTLDAGINVFNPATQSSFRLLIDNNHHTGLTPRTVWAIHQDKSNTIWFGTQGGGLVYIKAQDYAAGKLTTYSLTQSDGLLSNVVYGILEDDEGALWVSTNRGLSKLELTTQKFTHYTDAQGLLGREFNSGAYHKASNGKFYFGGPLGVTAFFPEQIRPRQTAPLVEITHIQKLNDFFTPGELLNSQGIIEFTHEDYLVGFQFAAMDFVSQRDNNYKFKLTGFDTGWVNAFNTRRATYTNLPPGEYEFQVIASNSDGVWNNYGAIQRVVVHPSLWLSPLAYAAYAIVVLSGAVLIVRMYLRKAQADRQYRKRLEREVSERTRELQFLNDKLLHASVTDQLTGLHNRRYLNELVPQLAQSVLEEFDSAATYSVAEENQVARMFFLMFDLDGFKPVNDTFGHDAGDKIIVQLGALLKQLTRSNDTVIRWGGDEFLVIGKIRTLDEVENLAERIRAGIDQYSFDIGHSTEVHLTSSIGFSIYPLSHRAPREVSWEQVHQLSDYALYQSKSAGRNTWTGVIESDREVEMMHLRRITADISKAILDDSIRLIQHQPDVFKSSQLDV